MNPPTTRPIMIQAVSDRRYQGLRGLEAISVVMAFIPCGKLRGIIDHNAGGWGLKSPSDPLGGRKQFVLAGLRIEPGDLAPREEILREDRQDLVVGCLGR